MTVLSFVWVYPYSQNSRCDTKKTEPGEPPRRRLCVDYRALNSLLPTIHKVGSKAKGVLTLVPLPKNR